MGCARLWEVEPTFLILRCRFHPVSISLPQVALPLLTWTCEASTVPQGSGTLNQRLNGPIANSSTLPSILQVTSYIKETDTQSAAKPKKTGAHLYHSKGNTLAAIKGRRPTPGHPGVDTWVDPILLSTSLNCKSRCICPSVSQRIEH